MNNDLEQFSEERLKKLIISAEGVTFPTFFELQANDTAALARIALSAKQAKPVTMDALRDAVAEMSGGLQMEWRESIDKGHHPVPFINFNSLHRIVTKYTTPQPAHTEVNTPVIPDGWKLVPIEMTDIMKKAYYDSSLAPISKLSVTGYRALIAAAPKPEIK